MAAGYDTVLFDLDGTLLDTLDDLAASINFALTAVGFAPRTVQEVRGFVGNGAKKLVERAVPAQASAGQMRAVFETYTEHYALHLEDRTRPYDGIEALLSALFARGVRIAVVSNKPDAAAKPLVARRFGALVAVTVGEGGDVLPKPAPGGTLLAMRQLDADPKRSLYVGDSPVDVQTAHNAGLACVGCSWGFRGRAALEDAGADFIIDRPEELLALL